MPAATQLSRTPHTCSTNPPPNSLTPPAPAQDLLESDGNGATDASGNPILKDIGTYLKAELKKAFKDADIKYIDPSYIIRSIPTTSNDRIYCKVRAGLGDAAPGGR